MDLSDEDIKRIAKERVAFKQHVGVYVIVNSMFVVLWFITNRSDLTWANFWPVWPMFGWGIGLAFHGFGAYGPERGMLAREEERVRAKYGK